VGESDGALADVVHLEFMKALDRINSTLIPRGVTVVHRWKVVDRDGCVCVAACSPRGSWLCVCVCVSV
jgi:hypothetical protein